MNVTIKNVALLFLWTGAIAVISFWSLPEPSMNRGETTKEVFGEPSGLPSYATAEAYRALKQRRVWGESDDTSSKQGGVSRELNWVLRGVVQQGERSAALIYVDGKIERYFVGEKLPDGRNLVTIYDSEIVSSDQNGQQLVHEMHQGE